MTMFPGATAQVYRNEVGEPIGWDYPSDDPMDHYCDMCGVCHVGECRYDDEPDDYCRQCGEAVEDSASKDPCPHCGSPDYDSPAPRAVYVIETAPSGAVRDAWPCDDIDDALRVIAGRLTHPEEDAAAAHDVVADAWERVADDLSAFSMSREHFTSSRFGLMERDR